MATGRDNGPRPVNINPYERSLLPTDPQFANLLMNWSHYRQRLVVFLGAGASVGARSKTNGYPLPTAFSLRNLIWRAFMCDAPDMFKPEDIQLVSLEHAAALAERCVGRAALLELLAGVFHVEAPLWQHAVLPFLQPSAIFSPNYDSLIEDGWRLHSSAEGIARLRPYYRDERPDTTPHVPLYKPHGTLERLTEPIGDGGIVITQFDYIKMLRYRREAPDRCLGNTENACVVFIGYSFQDLDIAASLYAIRNPQEKRTIPWYAVFPRNDENVRAMYDERYGIRQINRTFFNFLVELDDAVNFIPEPWKVRNLDTLSGIMRSPAMHHTGAEAGIT
ncbi:MAG: SIR2 family protein [Bryobacteraceae bacterium]|jgi:hypothetical protein